MLPITCNVCAVLQVMASATPWATVVGFKGMKLRSSVGVICGFLHFWGIFQGVLWEELGRESGLFFDFSLRFLRWGLLITIVMLVLTY